MNSAATEKPTSVWEENVIFIPPQTTHENLTA